ncbi:MAG: helix-turn-helix domain-containing protein [Acidobacteriota bacterium]
MNARARRRGQWLTIPQAAAQYSGHVSATTIRRLAKSGVLRARQVGRCWDVLAADLHRYMNGTRRHTNA